VTIGIEDNEENFLGIGLGGNLGWNDEGNLALILGYVVEYEDTQPPTITCPADITQATDPGQCTAVINYAASATDNCGPVTVVCNPLSGTAFPIGPTQVCCTATDGAGHASACCFNVTVTVGNRCPLAQGYWKNHPGAWPSIALPMLLGGQTYNQTELLTLLNTPPMADASLILARQLVPAILSTANSSDPRPVCDTIAQANLLLSNFTTKLPNQVKINSPIGAEMIGLANTLTEYNTGLLTSACQP
jgi:hypothetical protein